MNTEKFLNIYRHQKNSLDEVRGMLRDLDDATPGNSRETILQQRNALTQLLREKLQAQKI